MYSSTVFTITLLALSLGLSLLTALMTAIVLGKITLFSKTAGHQLHGALENGWMNLFGLGTLRKHNWEESCDPLSQHTESTWLLLYSYNNQVIFPQSLWSCLHLIMMVLLNEMLMTCSMRYCVPDMLSLLIYLLDVCVPAHVSACLCWVLCIDLCVVYSLFSKYA